VSDLSPDRGSALPVTANRREGGEGLLDVLDRVLDKGLVIAGDIQINLLDIELLTIKVRLLIASADKAREMGIDWWAHDPQLSSSAKQDQKKLPSSTNGHHDENKQLNERLERLEAQLGQLLQRAPAQRSSRKRAGGALKGR